MSRQDVEIIRSTGWRLQFFCRFIVPGQSDLAIYL